jgi:carbon-monoxide dehydrogenase medium subunit
MYPRAFDYYRPGNVAEAIDLLQQNPEAKILAGGHSLLPMMKLRVASPVALIDLNRIADLRGIRNDGDTLVFGAMTTYRQILEDENLKLVLPIIPETANVVGDIQVRNRGTIGGSMAHADPASDFPAVMLALDAEFKATGPNGERTVGATDFFLDLFTTALDPSEVLTEIRVRQPQARTGMAYEKFAHPASGYAIVGVAAVVTLGNDGLAESVRVAITGAGPIASRRTAVEEALTGQEPTAENVKAAAQKAADGMELMGDIQAGEEYRAHLARVLTERALNRAIASARG